MTSLLPAIRLKDKISRQINKEGVVVTISPNTPHSRTANALMGIQVRESENQDPVVGAIPEIKNSMFVFTGDQYGLILIGMKMSITAPNGRIMTYEVNFPHPVIRRTVCIQLEVGAALISTQ